jgi:hypothetical protein
LAAQTFLWKSMRPILVSANSTEDAIGFRVNLAFRWYLPWNQDGFLGTCGAPRPGNFVAFHLEIRGGTICHCDGYSRCMFRIWEFRILCSPQRLPQKVFCLSL